MDAWTNGGPYEVFIGRWSRQVARDFVGWLKLKTGLGWIDVGCGTGALTQVVLNQCAPRWVVGIDPSPGYLDHARKAVADARVEFRPGSAEALPCPDGSADVAVAGLSLNFVPHPSVALTEMQRAVRPGGTVAAYVWDYSDGMQMLRFFWEAAVSLDPAAASLDEGQRFPITQEDSFRELFARSGLADIHMRSIEVPMEFRKFDDYWTPFVGAMGQGPAPTYLGTLSEESRDALRHALERRLPLGKSGSIRLVARAWAATGTCSGTALR